MSKAWNRIDMTGWVMKEHGVETSRLTVIKQVESRKDSSGATRGFWLCRCECGNEIITDGRHVRNGSVRSCGCLQKEVVADNGRNSVDKRRTHGMTGTKLYHTWWNMKARCFDPNNKKFDCYGGRGIVVCDEWKDSFENFMLWSISNGYSDELTIDRIDVNGNYEPSNCRWVAWKEQCRNKRNNKIITIDGEAKCLQDWCNQVGISPSTVEGRWKRGWDDKKAIFEPVRRK